MLPGEDEQTLVSHEYIWQLLRRHGRTPDDLEILRAVVYSHHVRFAALRNIGFRAVMRVPPLRAAADGASSGRVLGKSIGSLPISPATSSQRPRPYGQVSR